MVISLGQQYNVGEKPTVILYVVSHIQRIGCQPEKLLDTVANPARGLLKREKRTKEKVWQHTPPHTARSEKINKIKLRDASTGATQVLVGLASVQGYLRLVD